MRLNGGNLLENGDDAQSNSSSEDEDDSDSSEGDSSSENEDDNDIRSQGSQMSNPLSTERDLEEVDRKKSQLLIMSRKSMNMRGFID